MTPFYLVDRLLNGAEAANGLDARTVEMDLVPGEGEVEHHTCDHVIRLFRAVDVQKSEGDDGCDALKHKGKSQPSIRTSIHHTDRVNKQIETLYRLEPFSDEGALTESRNFLAGFWTSQETRR